MSMHKIPLTQLEEDGLRAHGLYIGSPSQLSDVFRHGIKWALEQTAPQPEQSGLANKLRALAEIWAQNADEADEFGNAQAAEALRLAAFELRAALSAQRGEA